MFSHTSEQDIDCDLNSRVGRKCADMHGNIDLITYYRLYPPMRRSLMAPLSAGEERPRSIPPQWCLPPVEDMSWQTE